MSTELAVGRAPAAAARAMATHLEEALVRFGRDLDGGAP